MDFTAAPVVLAVSETLLLGFFESLCFTSFGVCPIITMFVDYLG